MLLPESSGGGHLTYCTNIHAAEHWPDVRRGLQEHLPAIKAAFSPTSPMGVGLRVAASCAGALREPSVMESLEELLADDFYVFTFNGFPYGAFHGQRVKDGAYRPDWSEPERLSYTNLLADQLAHLLPDGMPGSVSTVPCTYKPWLASAEERTDRIVEHLIEHVAHLVQVHRSTGKTINLALEPEPFCMLETIDETVTFFQEQLYVAAAVARLAERAGLSTGEAEQAMREHLSVCYDVCHAAVEFEDPAASIESLRAAGIPIGKLQLSSALKVDPVTAQAIDALRAFDEPVYLHQTIQRRDGELTRFEDLGAAFDASADLSRGDAPRTEWRSHFHVPVFLERMEHFGTTQDFLRDVLSLHRQGAVSGHLEVETYTWDVLPPEYRNVDLSSAIARELNWVRAELGAPATERKSDAVK